MSPEFAIPFGMFSIVLSLLAFVMIWMRFNVPVTVRLEGNGKNLNQMLAALLEAQVEQIEMRRGPILGSVNEDGKTITLHTQVQCIDEEGRLILAERVKPGSFLGLLEV